MSTFIPMVSSSPPPMDNDEAWVDDNSFGEFATVNPVDHQNGDGFAEFTSFDHSSNSGVQHNSFQPIKVDDPKNTTDFESIESSQNVEPEFSDWTDVNAQQIPLQFGNDTIDEVHNDVPSSLSENCDNSVPSPTDDQTNVSISPPLFVEPSIVKSDAIDNIINTGDVSQQSLPDLGLCSSDIPRATSSAVTSSVEHPIISSVKCENEDTESTDSLSNVTEAVTSQSNDNTNADKNIIDPENEFNDESGDINYETTNEKVVIRSANTDESISSHYISAQTVNTPVRESSPAPLDFKPVSVSEEDANTLNDNYEVLSGTDIEVVSREVSDNSDSENRTENGKDTSQHSASVCNESQANDCDSNLQPVHIDSKSVQNNCDMDQNLKHIDLSAKLADEHKSEVSAKFCNSVQDDANVSDLHSNTEDLAEDMKNNCESSSAKSSDNECKNKEQPQHENLSEDEILAAKSVDVVSEISEHLSHTENTSYDCLQSETQAQCEDTSDVNNGANSNEQEKLVERKNTSTSGDCSVMESSAQNNDAEQIPAEDEMDDEWSAFDTGQIPTASNDNSGDTTPANEDNWAAFGGTPKAEDTQSGDWAAFGDDATPDPADVDDDDWDAFADATPAAADATPAAADAASHDAEQEFAAFESHTVSTVDYQPKMVYKSLRSVLVECFPQADLNGNLHCDSLLLAQNIQIIDSYQQEVVNKPSARQRETRSVISIDRCVWNNLKDMEHTVALKYQWAHSDSNQVLLQAINVDTRNMLVGHKKPAVPIFAAGLGVLEPTRTLEPLSAPTGPQIGIVDVTGSSTAGNTQDIPPVDFNWNDSGLTNPLDAVKKEREMLQALQRDENNVSKHLPTPRPLEHLLAGISSVKPQRVLSLDAQHLLSDLPDLSFMRAKVLMFPLTGNDAIVQNDDS